MLRNYYSRWLLYPAVFLLLIANTINAGTDIGAIGAAINLVVPIPISYLIVPIAVLIVALQFWGSYRLITRVFKWLTLTLFAYIGAAFLAKPHWREVLQSHSDSDDHLRQKLPDDDSCDPGNYDFTLSLLLAGKSGGRGRNQYGAQQLLRNVEARHSQS